MTAVAAAAAAIPYSCQTGPYTIDQLGGEDCGKCGLRIAPGQASYELKQVAEWTVYAHVSCPKVGVSK